MNPKPSLFVAYLLIACSQSDSLDEIVADHIVDTGLEFADCGSYTNNSDGTCDIDAPLLVEFQCLHDAFDTCEPARLDTTLNTVEGDSIFSVYLVEPVGDACQLTVFVDHSEDEFKGDYGDIVQSECTTLIETGCSTLNADECATVQEWY